jgi:copper(I)-binding protein
MRKIIGFAAFLAVLGVLAGVAWADKSYRVSFTEPVMLGTLPVQPGQYDLVVDQPAVRLKDVNSGETTDLKAQIVNAERKYERTAVISSHASGQAAVQEIQLGGAKMRVVFQAEAGQ